MAGSGDHQVRRLPAFLALAVALTAPLILGGCAGASAGPALMETGAVAGTAPPPAPMTAARTTAGSEANTTEAVPSSPGAKPASLTGPAAGGTPTRTDPGTTTAPAPAPGTPTTAPTTSSPTPSATGTDSAAGGYSATGPVSATGTPASSAEGEPTVLPTSASTTLYYIALGDAGTSGPALGCGDSAIPITSTAITFTDPVEGALRTLLADHSQRLGASALDNALWQSRLAVRSIDRTGPTVTANLTGTLELGGACDIPRIEQQLLLTARAAAGGPVAVTVNGKPLSAVLSAK